MKKKLLKPFVVLLVVFLTACKYSIVTNETRFAIIKDRTNLVIPNDVTCLRSYDFKRFRHGRLPSYWVFSFESEPIDFLRDNHFVNNIDAETQEWVNKTIDNTNNIDGLNIPHSDYPNWDKEYLCYCDEYHGTQCGDCEYCLIYYVGCYEMAVFFC